MRPALRVRTMVPSNCARVNMSLFMNVRPVNWRAPPATVRRSCSTSAMANADSTGSVRALGWPRHNSSHWRATRMKRSDAGTHGSWAIGLASHGRNHVTQARAFE